MRRDEPNTEKNDLEKKEGKIEQDKVNESEEQENKSSINDDDFPKDFKRFLGCGG